MFRTVDTWQDSRVVFAPTKNGSGYCCMNHLKRSARSHPNPFTCVGSGYLATSMSESLNPISCHPRLNTKRRIWYVPTQDPQTKADSFLNRLSCSYSPALPQNSADPFRGTLNTQFALNPKPLNPEPSLPPAPCRAPSFPRPPLACSRTPNP